MCAHCGAERAIMALALMLMPATAPAQGDDTTIREAWQPPTLSITRYDEDWSDLADAEKRTHHWTGPYKYIPLGSDAWLSTGIELRARNENYRANGWGGAQAPNDSYLWLRAMPYVDLHLGDSKLHARAFIQPIAGYALGVSPQASAIDQSRVDLLQGFIEVGSGALSVRAGRQMVSLGTERLVGTRYGPNTPLAFDGVRGIVKTKGGAQVDFFSLAPVTPGPASFDDRTSSTRRLWGAYAALPGLDLYVLHYRNRAATTLAQRGREMRTSLGARLHGSRSGWHWNVEGVAQFGHFDAANGTRSTIAAWTLATEIGHTLRSLPLAPDATLRVNVVSGDTHPGDGRIGTFNAMFPKGKYFGELSPVGPINMISVNPRLAAPLGHGFSASLAAMGYWRYTLADGIYDIPGNLVRAAGNSHARFIGTEAEAALAWQATPELELSSSLSAFAPGAFIRETGPARTIGLAGFEANFRF